MTSTNILTPCSAPGCSRQKASHLLMCVQHWSSVPENIQERVYAGYRKMQDGKSARDWLIARELARLHVAVNAKLAEGVIDSIEAEIERLEGVRL